MRSNISRPDITERLVARAIEAYLGACVIDGLLPVSSDSGVVVRGAHRLVVLRNGKRVLAVYKVIRKRNADAFEAERIPKVAVDGRDAK
jgi:hypothetical protein